VARIKDWVVRPSLPRRRGAKDALAVLGGAGEDDEQIPLKDAQSLYDASGSADKTLRVFTAEEGGAQHCQRDYSLARHRHYVELAGRKNYYDRTENDQIRSIVRRSKRLDSEKCKRHHSQ
jgi:hypothetical protein